MSRTGYLLFEDFFGVVLTILPEPSFKVWMVYDDRLSKCSTSVRSPFFALILAPIPSRLERVPTVLNAIQWSPEWTLFTNKLGVAYTLLISTESCPSFQRSPTAKPRADDDALIPGPASAETSVKVPLPLL